MSSKINGRIKHLFLIVIFMINTLFWFSCTNQESYPKPRGYLRIDLPAPTYQTFDSTFPYRFLFSGLAQINFEGLTPETPYWMNIDYPAFQGRIHLSYKSLQKNKLYSLQEDSRNMVFKHASKAMGIREANINLPESKVYGIVYTIEGKDAASPFQFYLTDSTNHFIRGALYFNVIPNNDSLKPVIDFIINDIDVMVSTLKWKTVSQ
jgi:gliding motility-associated lipoprotein GldD